MSRLKTSLPESLAASVKATIADWQSGGKMQRLWQRDAKLWTGRRRSRSGWAGSILSKSRPRIRTNCRNSRKKFMLRGFEHVLLLGMGGSSLCPGSSAHDVWQDRRFPNLHVLDSTDPAQVKAFEHQIDIAKTLFIVSSKSGSTLEPNIFKQYFFERTKQAVGADKAGSTSSPSPIRDRRCSRSRKRDHFLHVFFGRPSIGGRYSALSNFGMVPAAVIGIDTKKFLSTVQRRWCAPAGPSTSVEENPGAALGIILGHGREGGSR